MIFFLKHTKALEKLTKQAAEYSSGNIARKINVDEYPDALKPLASHIALIVDTLRSFTQESQVSSSQVLGGTLLYINSICISNLA